MDASASTPRGRFSLLAGRWHASSRAVAGLVLAFLVVCNLPGQFAEKLDVDDQSINFYHDRRFEHGWPLTFLRRSYVSFKGGECRDVQRACWQFWADKREMYPGLLIFNLFVAVSIAVGGGFAFELWRRRRRRLWQLHLRDLIGLVIAVSVLLAWYVANRRQHTLEQAIASKSSGGLGRVHWREGGITWVRALAADRWFQPFDRVMTLEIDRDDLAGAAQLSNLELVIVWEQVDSKDLRQLESFPRLKLLDLNGAYFDNRLQNPAAIALPHLPKLRGLVLANHRCSFSGLPRLHSLESLDLSGTKVTETTLNELCDLPRLKHLSLANTELNQYGIAKLTKLTQLESLNLDGLHLNDIAMRHLGTMTGLRNLSLSGANFPAGSLSKLEMLTGLEQLALSESFLEETDFKAISRVPQLHYLDLSRTPIGAAGISHLKQSRRLRTLIVHRAFISQEDLDLLRAAIPNCDLQIHYY